MNDADFADASDFLAHLDSIDDDRAARRGEDQHQHEEDKEEEEEIEDEYDLLFAEVSKKYIADDTWEGYQKSVMRLVIWLYNNERRCLHDTKGFETFIRAVYYLLNSIARQTSLEIREFTLPGPGPC